MTPEQEKLAKTVGLTSMTIAEEIAQQEAEIKFLRERIAFKEARIAQLRGELPSPACEICGSIENVRRAGAWLIGKDMKICSCCFSVWYDEAMTNTEAIKQRSLQIRAQAAEYQGQKKN